MAGPEEYSLKGTSEKRMLPCGIGEGTLLLIWFMAGKLLSHLAVDDDKVIIRFRSYEAVFDFITS